MASSIDEAATNGSDSPPWLTSAVIAFLRNVTSLDGDYVRVDGANFSITKLLVGAGDSNASSSSSMCNATAAACCSCTSGASTGGSDDESAMARHLLFVVSIATATVLVVGLWFALRFLLPSSPAFTNHLRMGVIEPLTTSVNRRMDETEGRLQGQHAKIQELTSTVNDLVGVIKAMEAQYQALANTEKSRVAASAGVYLTSNNPRGGGGGGNKAPQLRSDDEGQERWVTSPLRRKASSSSVNADAAASPSSTPQQQQQHTIVIASPRRAKDVICSDTTRVQH